MKISTLRGTLKRWFHESTKIETSDYQNVENFSHEAWYLRKICSHEAWYPLIVDFTTRQNCIFETQKLIKFPPSLRGTLKRWFHESAEIAFSGCQNAENLITRKIRSNETWYPSNVYFTTEQNAFLGLQNHENFHSARYLETLVSRIGRNRIFRLPKCWRFVNTENSFTRKLGTLETHC